MITDWIQAICAIVMAVSAAWGVFISLPKISKDTNKSADERQNKLEQQWKRLIDLYANNPKMHEYSNINEKGNAEGDSHQEG